LVPTRFTWPAWPPNSAWRSPRAMPSISGSRP
jgi:hypothetical protein